MAMASNFSASFFPSNSFFRRLLGFGGSSDGEDTAPDTSRVFPVSFFSPDSFRRLLRSFASSDLPNQSTADSSPPSPGYDENLIRSAMEMETGSPTAADREQNSKGVRELVPTVSLAVAALCCGIYSSIPPTVQLHPDSPLFYDFLIAFVSLGVFTSLGLFMYSLLRPEGAEVAWDVQKKVVLIAIIFFLIAFLLRIALLLPVASFGYVSLVVFFMTAVIALYLFTARKKNPRDRRDQDPDYRLPISLPPRTEGGGN